MLKKWHKVNVRADKVAVFCALLFDLCGCKTRYITTEVPVTIHDSVRVVQTERVTDTIWYSNIVNVIDTMWLDTSTVATIGMPVLHHDRTTSVTNNRQERSNKTIADTVYMEREKPVPYKVEVPITKPLNRWQKVMIWIGSIALALLGLGALWRIKRMIN